MYNTIIIFQVNVGWMRNETTTIAQNINKVFTSTPLGFHNIYVRLVCFFIFSFFIYIFQFIYNRIQIFSDLRSILLSCCYLISAIFHVNLWSISIMWLYNWYPLDMYTEHLSLPLVSTPVLYLLFTDTYIYTHIQHCAI